MQFLQKIYVGCRYMDGLINSFVEDNPSIKWCPAPGCTNAVLLKEVNQERNEAVTCNCGETF
jgi:ariadne-1